MAPCLRNLLASLDAPVRHANDATRATTRRRSRLAALPGRGRAGGVSEDISDSWRRARDAYRIDPGIERPARVLSPDALAERCERDEALGLAAPILRDFAARLALSGRLAYLDGDGWMLTIDGDRRVVELVEEINFRPGANWAEDSAGTNGPGTALAAGKPVEVFASSTSSPRCSGGAARRRR